MLNITKELDIFTTFLEEKNSQIKESVLDEPKDTLSPLVWDLGSARPTMNPEVKAEIFRGLEHIVGSDHIQKVFIVGSITGYRYGKNADIDVSVLIDATPEELKAYGKRAVEINGRFAPKTTFPINYFVLPETFSMDRFDSVYDLIDDKWLKPPKDYGIDLNQVYDVFKDYLKEIDNEKSEAIRSLMDIETLFSSLQRSQDPSLLFWKIVRRIKDLDQSITTLAEKYDTAHKQRIEAFKTFEAGNTRGLPSPNLLPENIRYKVLERYHYLDFMRQLYKLVKETGNIDSVDDIQQVREILQGEIPIAEEAKATCPEYREGGFRNHDEAGDPKKSGKDHFEKALKRMNDLALGKTKDKPTVKADRKSDQTEEKLESFGRLLLEVLSSYTYEMPKDKEQQLYDFYTLTMMVPNPKNISGPISSVSQLRDEDLDYAIEDTQNRLFEQLKQSLLEAVFFSICAEIRHVYDANRPANVLSSIEQYSGDESEKMFKRYTKEMIVAKQYPDLQRTPSTINRRLQDNDTDYVASYKSALSAIEKSKLEKKDFVDVCRFLFAESNWKSMFGGEKWEKIAEGWLKLNAATKNSDKMVWIDHVYDLQHNTNTVFNKVKSFLKHGSYSWLKKALDHKFKIKSPWELWEKSSYSMKRLAGYYFKARYGTTFEDFAKKNNDPDDHPAFGKDKTSPEKQPTKNVGANAKVSENAQVLDEAKVFDNAKVFGNAKVSGKAKVYDNALVRDDAQISGDAEIFNEAMVYEKASVYDKAKVYGKSKIHDNAKVFEEAQVYDEAKIFGKAVVYGHSNVFESARVYGNAEISDFAVVYGHTLICDDAQIYGNVKIYGAAKVHDKAAVFGNAMVFGNARVYGDANVYGTAKINKGSVNKGEFKTVEDCIKAGLYDPDLDTKEETPEKSQSGKNKPKWMTIPGQSKPVKFLSDQSKYHEWIAQFKDVNGVSLKIGDSVHLINPCTLNFLAIGPTSEMLGQDLGKTQIATSYLRLFKSDKELVITDISTPLHGVKTVEVGNPDIKHELFSIRLEKIEKPEEKKKKKKTKLPKSESGVYWIDPEGKIVGELARAWISVSKGDYAVKKGSEGWIRSQVISAGSGKKAISYQFYSDFVTRKALEGALEFAEIKANLESFTKENGISVQYAQTKDQSPTKKTFSTPEEFKEFIDKLKPEESESEPEDKVSKKREDAPILVIHDDYLEPNLVKVGVEVEYEGKKYEISEIVLESDLHSGKSRGIQKGDYLVVNSTAGEELYKGFICKFVDFDPDDSKKIVILMPDDEGVKNSKKQGIYYMHRFFWLKPISSKKTESEDLEAGDIVQIKVSKSIGTDIKKHDGKFAVFTGNMKTEKDGTKIYQVKLAADLIDAKEGNFLPNGTIVINDQEFSSTGEKTNLENISKPTAEKKFRSFTIAPTQDMAKAEKDASKIDLIRFVRLLSGKSLYETKTLIDRFFKDGNKTITVEYSGDYPETKVLDALHHYRSVVSDKLMLSITPNMGSGKKSDTDSNYRVLKDQEGNTHKVLKYSFQKEYGDQFKDINGTVLKVGDVVKIVSTVLSGKHVDDNEDLQPNAISDSYKNYLNKTFVITNKLDNLVGISLVDDKSMGTTVVTFRLEKVSEGSDSEHDEKPEEPEGTSEVGAAKDLMVGEQFIIRKWHTKNPTVIGQVGTVIRVEPHTNQNSYKVYLQNKSHFEGERSKHTIYLWKDHPEHQIEKLKNPTFIGLGGKSSLGDISEKDFGQIFNINNREYKLINPMDLNSYSDAVGMFAVFLDNQFKGQIVMIIYFSDKYYRFLSNEKPQTVSSENIEKMAGWFPKRFGILIPTDDPKFKQILSDDINEQHLNVRKSINEYCTNLTEGIVNRIEMTGGKLNRQKVSSTPGQRVDRGSQGALGTHRMSLRERMKRKKGAMKGNRKAKARGRMEIGNKKKVIGQKLNPNSDTR